MVLYPNQEKSKTKELKQLNINAMGRRIRVIRERKDLSREELAEKIGITPAFISDVEYGCFCGLSPQRHTLVHGQR